MEKKKVRIYTKEDVQRHRKGNDIWITYKGTVYDISSFIEDHPGGPEMIMPFAGHDLGDIMKDPQEHSHSDSAFDILEEFKIGILGDNTNIVSDDWEISDDFEPKVTEVEEDYQKTQFLNLNKPLLRQIWESNFSKSYYLQQIHQPRHLASSARLFGPEYLEVFTKTAWWVVPCFWLPIAAYLFGRAWNNSHGDLMLVIPAFLCGNFIWTILEYVLHRFLFHIDKLLPDHPVFITMHFLTHGIHHFLPMDRFRLVMPPILFFVLQYPFTKIFWATFSPITADAMVAGGYAFYVLYDVMHYSLHHNRFFGEHVSEMKKYHMAHHYKNFDSGFGVTSKIWDYVFGTVLVV